MGSFAEGIRMMIDGQYRFSRAGLKVYMRIQNFSSSGSYQELGVPYIPTNPNPSDTGYTDILIDPPPQVGDVSMHNIGMSGGKLLIGARWFKISHSFVLGIRARYPAVTDNIAVWSTWDKTSETDGTARVIGFVYENRMHEIVYYTHKEAAGETISWTLTCNRVDVPLDKGTQVQDQR